MGKNTVKDRRKRNTIKIIVIVIICGIGIYGFEYLSASGILQSFTQQASKTIPQTTSEIANKIAPQPSQQVITESPIPSTTSNTISSTNDDTRVPIAVYDNCQSLVRTDLNNIVAICNTTNFGQKQFTFALPTTLEQGLPSNRAFTFVKGYVYQYGVNDFKIGLYDQVGEKNYTVSLWQLPQ